MTNKSLICDDGLLLNIVLKYDSLENSVLFNVTWTCDFLCGFKSWKKVMYILVIWISNERDYCVTLASSAPVGDLVASDLKVSAPLCLEKDNSILQRCFLSILLIKGWVVNATFKVLWSLGSIQISGKHARKVLCCWVPLPPFFFSKDRVSFLHPCVSWN